MSDRVSTSVNGDEGEGEHEGRDSTGASHQLAPSDSSASSAPSTTGNLTEATSGDGDASASKVKSYKRTKAVCISASESSFIAASSTSTAPSTPPSQTAFRGPATYIDYVASARRGGSSSTSIPPSFLPLHPSTLFIFRAEVIMSNPTIPQPGPAKLGPKSTVEEWLEQAKVCKYLPEAIMKELCERVKECLMEESNIQPVSTPVTICGDIHGQFYDLLELFCIAGGMPGETDVKAPTTMLNTDALEPPTEITDPKLKKKIKQTDSGIESASGEDEDEDDEPRGRPRTAGSIRAQSTDSGINVNNNPNIAPAQGGQNFIFLGDFVDRGYFSLETFTLLLCLKALYPNKITLVRGNHESRQITQVYGFYEECQTKYGNASVWKSCCQVFDFLVLAAIVDGEVLCVHGGLSPEIRTVDQIRVVARAQEIPHEGAFCDLVWSDPEEVETWSVSPRGAGWLFGDKVATEFNHVNGLKLIARAHQLVNEGYKYHFNNNSVVTVWSAPNYCYRCGNVASIMNIGEDLNPRFSIFSAVPDERRAVPANRRTAGDYFL